MTDQITLEEALELVEFRKSYYGKWYVDTVRGDCYLIEGNCHAVKGFCETVEGNCGTVEGSCLVVKGNCDIVEGNCGIVEGTVCRTINGRKWQYVETPKEKLQRLIEEGANKEQLLEAINQLEDN